MGNKATSGAVNGLEKYVQAKDRLREAELECLRASSHFMRVFAPKMHDLSYVEKIWAWTRETHLAHGFTAIEKDIRKQYLFVSLLLYSPAALFGGEMKRTIRNAIFSVLGVTARSAQSVMRRKTVDWYDMYQEFRIQCNTVVREVEDRLREAGVLD